MAWRIGVDIGGTFTDVVVALDDGRVVRDKSLTTPEDYWPRVEQFAFFDVSGATPMPIDGSGRDALGVAAKDAQKLLVRHAEPDAQIHALGTHALADLGVQEPVPDRSGKLPAMIGLDERHHHVEGGDAA